MVSPTDRWSRRRQTDVRRTLLNGAVVLHGDSPPPRLSTRPAKEPTTDVTVRAEVSQPPPCLPWARSSCGRHICTLEQKKGGLSQPRVTGRLQSEHIRPATQKRTIQCLLSVYRGAHACQTTGRLAQMAQSPSRHIASCGSPTT